MSIKPNFIVDLNSFVEVSFVYKNESLTVSAEQFFAQIRLLLGNNAIVEGGPSRPLSEHK